ncbi:hypothetical protein Agub_g2477 [Astrephomene gubernaculifera]|uniref:UBX domain-containing protein n=1 Tax=Astrephomene gubernaculifera TaxID=47775 RepID=A0AAD3DH44_9CHLO|nr:hypothetical protein Agub_g2477 [Astrephomene gubernaculifera]
MTPEALLVSKALGVLVFAYFLRHWEYYVYVFPRTVLHLLDLRHQTLFPRTPWGFVVRIVIAYFAYKGYLKLQRRWDEYTVQRLHRRLAAKNEAQRLSRVEQHQQAASEAAAAAAAAAEAMRRQREAEAAQAARETSPEERDADAGPQPQQGDWLERLQAQQDAAAAARRAAEAARLAAATAAAAAPAANPAVADPAAAAAAAAAGRAQESSTQQAGSSGSNGSGGPSVAGPTRRRAAESSGAEGSGRQSQPQAPRDLPSPLDWQMLSPLQREAMNQERALRAEQDAEYEAALAEDRRRAEERAAAEAAEAEAQAAAAAAAEAEAVAAEAALQRRQELRERLRRELPSEPDSSDPAGVLVRVRLPDGCSHTRRFLQEAPVQQIRDWLQSLDSFPAWEPDHWNLVNSYPRQVLEGGVAVAEVAGGARQVALFVQEN